MQNLSLRGLRYNFGVHTGAAGEALSRFRGGAPCPGPGAHPHPEAETLSFWLFNGRDTFARFSFFWKQIWKPCPFGIRGTVQKSVAYREKGLFQIDDVKCCPETDRRKDTRSFNDIVSVSRYIYTHIYCIWQPGGWINMKHNINKNNIIVQRNYIW